jgi:hypothetical protein
MRRAALVFVLPLLAAGCASGPAPTDAPAIKAADKEATAARQACLKRYEAGELTMAQSVECSNPKIIAAFEGANYPYMDLLRLGMDARLAGAQKVDRGDLSAEEYQRQLTELRKRIAAEMRRRNSGASDADLEGKPVPTYPQTADASEAAKLLDGLGAFQTPAR